MQKWSCGRARWEGCGGGSKGGRRTWDVAPGEESGGQSLGPENEGHKSRSTRSKGRTPGKHLEGST